MYKADLISSNLPNGKKLAHRAQKNPCKQELILALRNQLIRLPR